MNRISKQGRGGPAPDARDGKQAIDSRRAAGDVFPPTRSRKPARAGAMKSSDNKTKSISNRGPGGFFALMGLWITAPFRYKTLFKGFVNQEIRGRYAASMGGFIWYVLTPLTNLFIYIFIFSVVLQLRLRPMETGTDSFVIYLLSGLLPWLAFSEAAAAAPGMIVEKAGLITKMAFPTEILPLSGVTVTYLINGVGLFLLLGYLAIEGYCSVMWLWAPVVMAAQMAFTLGFVIMISSLTVFIRDIQQFIGIGIQLWFYLTPIFYPLSMVPERYRSFFMFNPMYPFIELYHMILLRHEISWMLMGYCGAASFLLLIAAILFFNRAKNAFADVL
ncbi:MAG: ABC transporter permease [Desulfobacterales bacterium]|nr:ABC transporter permease [Desulfobacterales bacterium]